ncbi:MAG: hypothetical protein LBE55_02730 [Clostridiales bacterium]|jgi:hypothetical protein|nr:hypothetical protein [Clostridiales bacterium]
MNNEEKILGILEKMQADMAGLQADMAEVKAALGDVKEGVIFIENDHSQGIKALHDGYVMAYDISREIRNEVLKINLREQCQDTRLMTLELGFDEFKRKLSARGII